MTLHRITSESLVLIILFSFCLLLPNFSQAQCENIDVIITPDCWGTETSWEIRDDLDVVVFSVPGGTYGNAFPNGSAEDTTVVCLPDGCYTFTIFDSFGDGQFGSQWGGCDADGSYRLEDSVDNILVLSPDPNFGTEMSHGFCIPFGAPVQGCTNAAACNYDPLATVDDGSCILPDGCTDPAACNYDPANLCDDGSCLLPDGCPNPIACNYDPGATCDDGSCIICPFPDVCITVIMTDGFGDGWDAGSYTITDEATATVVATGTLANGAGPQSDYHCFPDGCYSFNIGGSAFPNESGYELQGADGGPYSGLGPDFFYFTINDPGCNFGCTNAAACNFDPGATVDDGSCVFPGCTDPLACNYDPSAGCDDGSCNLPDGCTDPAACNYDPAATCDNGSCDLSGGCTDPAACNYNASANCDDGSCNQCFVLQTCIEVVMTDGFGDGWDAGSYTIYDASTNAVVGTGTLANGTGPESDFYCLSDGCYRFEIGGSAFPNESAYTVTGGDSPINGLGPDIRTFTINDPGCIFGCTDSAACNYDASANADDGSCGYTPDGCVDPSACNFDPAASCDDGSCILPNGCTDPAACNYDPGATCDDGSCNVGEGCTDPAACNYDPAAQCDDGTCSFTPDGCVDPSACNYDPLATCDNGTCILPDGCTDTQACNFDPAATCDDGSCQLPDGCTNPSACNYDPANLCDDGSCILPNGCTNSAACNFDPAATCDDGSCDLSGGCTDPAACNYDAGANCDDGSCELPDGCTNPAACNYWPPALCDDGTCVLGATWYQDNDGDFYGDDNNTSFGCAPPAGYTSQGGDCDDTRDNVYPGAPGSGEGIDNNCNGQIDPSEVLSACPGDYNGDGFVDVADLLALLAEFGCLADCETDLNGDDAVTSSDLLVFLTLYGQACP